MPFQRHKTKQNKKEQNMSNEELLAKIRAKLNKTEGSRANDPFKFTVPALAKGVAKSWYFIVLPPLQKGDTVQGGKKAAKGMDDLPYVKIGNHWLAHEKKLLECPRVTSGEKCDLCALGFSLMEGVDDPAQRAAIREQYLSREQHLVNVYFPPIEGQPEEVKGKVMWFPITQRKIYSKFRECLERDKPTGVALKKQAYGIFWPHNNGDDANENVCYIYEVHATNKIGTKYNDYDGSDFLVDTRGPIENFIPEGMTYQYILDQRHDLSSKFREPDVAKIQQAVEDIAKRLNSDTSESANAAPAQAAPAAAQAPMASLKMTRTTPAAAPQALVQESAQEEAEQSEGSAGNDDPDLAAMVARLTGKKK